jgi:hypothetical protein
VIGRPLAALACQRGFAYLDIMAQPLASPHEMTPQSRASSRVGAAIAWGGAGVGSIVLLGALGLWFHYGTSVFFEMIASGISACF